MIPINSTQSALEALDHEDAGVRYHGAWWLGKHRTVEAIPKLVECLKDKREVTCTGGYPLRRQAARSLGMIRNPICVPDLIRTLETDDAKLHEATLRALIEIKDNRCIKSLIYYLDKNINDKPIEALIEALAAHKAWEASDKVRPYLDSDCERITSSAASFFFVCTGDITYLNTIISFLDHDNRFVRQSAAFDLARIAHKRATAPIINANIPNNIKLFAIKSILQESIKASDSPHENASNKLDGLHQELFKQLDNLVRENFSGNLLDNQSLVAAQNHIHSTPSPTKNTPTEAFEKLKSPSLTTRQSGIKQLVQTSVNQQESLLSLYFSETDQDIKMGIIKAMAELKQAIFLPAFLDAIGVEIGNHCQGNIRRVAACAIGEIDWQLELNTNSMAKTIEKLDWALLNPEDWGLRYSACLALKSINTGLAMEVLHKAKAKEKDPVVSTRIAMALSTPDVEL